MRVGIVVQEGYFGSAVSSIVDILTTAELVRPEVDPSIPALSVEVAAHRRRVTSTGGMTVKASRTLHELDDFELIVVPGLGTITAADTVASIESRTGRAVVNALRAIDPRRSRFAAACTGVFPLAETGMLDGRHATTTWFLTPTFRRRYPSVALDLDHMVVVDGPIITAGAAFAHIDLALAILRGVSAQLTRHVARMLLVDERPSQAAHVLYDHLQHDDPLVLAFERHVRRHLDEPFDVSMVAQAIATSRRTLERRTRQVLGMSPLDIVHRLRVERASHLRRTTDLSTEAIAQRVGYANAETLRALERRALRKPSEAVQAGRPEIV
jgi:transcriptional regulator GlxA family with amidase domain